MEARYCTNFVTLKNIIFIEQAYVTRRSRLRFAATDGHYKQFISKETANFIPSNINNVTYRPTARQRLGKHIPAEANAHNNRTSTARQRMSKHASLTIETMSSAWSV
jgi:histone acetyltransferase (RNA polymerase elongator complex component)